jgi:hypothetical protein
MKAYHDDPAKNGTRHVIGRSVHHMRAQELEDALSMREDADCEQDQDATRNTGRG